ncbi:hypothetical protein VNO77_01651 [Canavalia gladiata]|uniref:Squalene cyclase N-terminal domain-containing protein n=1 Tax=Canavalia gladiata TaxID=3824 RepID=A0AAN9RAG6_CANGL
MWRLKMAYGGNDPHIFSLNNFVGRQIWEFDPNAGSTEERAQVEAARQDFFDNRFKVKACGDRLWRFQILREKNFKQRIEGVRTEEKEEIKCEKLTATLQRAVRYLSAIQTSDGHWPAQISGPLFFIPYLVISLYVTEHLDSIFSEEHRKEILRYMYCHQNEDGGWGLHIEGHSIMLCTTLSYICMRIFGEGPDGGLNNACAKARKWIHDHGGVTHLPSWGKSWLSEDIYYPHPMIQDLIWDSLYIFIEPFFARWPFNKLIREKALQTAMKHIHYEDENSRYISIGCVSKTLSMLTCWVENPNGDTFMKHLARVPDYLWISEDGMTMQSIGSQIWDIGFGVQAVVATNLIEETGPILAKAHDFIKKKVRSRTTLQEILKVCIVTLLKGPGLFLIKTMDGNFLIALQKCCLLLSMLPQEVVGEKMKAERLYDSVNVILSLQSKNGGVTAWEPAAVSWLEVCF